MFGLLIATIILIGIGYILISKSNKNSEEGTRISRIHSKPLNRAKAAWKHVSWMEKMNYGSFDEYFKKDDWKRMPDKDNVSGQTFNNFISFIVVIIIIYIAFIGVKSLYNKTSNIFEESSNQKKACSQSSEVLNAQSEFAAKKAYKACMR